MLSLQELLEFENQLLRGLTLKQAANAIQKSIKDVRLGYRDHDRQWPQATGESTDILCKRIHDLLEQSLTQREISAELGLSQAYVSKLITRFEIGANVKSSWKQTIESDCKEVIDYLLENGGTVNQAIKRLDKKLHHQTVRKRAQELGIDLQTLRHANKQFGYWEILPVKPQQVYASDYLVYAVCHKCNTKHWVSLINLKSGSSTQCSTCARRAHRYREVVNKSTGQVWRSIRAFAKDIKQAEKYQTIRKKLAAHGSISINNEEYCLR